MALAQTVDIETPELVVVSYTVAGVGSRTVAALIDYAICITAIVVVFIAASQTNVRLPSLRESASSTSGTWILATLTVIQFAVLWLYYVLFEALMDGQTPGKRFMHLRVVLEGGVPITFSTSAVRNLVRIVDMQPAFFYAVGFISIIANRRARRLGDFAAGTMVVKEGLITAPMSASSARTPRRAPGDNVFASPVPVMLSTVLSDAEFGVLDRFAQRRMELEPARRERLAFELAKRFGHVLEQQPSQLPVAQLVRLHDSEQAARAQGVAAKGDTGAARERYAIVASSSARWADFATQVSVAKRRGLKALDEGEVRKFAQDYREVAADLARLRTAARGAVRGAVRGTSTGAAPGSAAGSAAGTARAGGANDIHQSLPASDVFYLNRLVANAHSLLYRRRAISVKSVVQYLLVDVPVEIRNSWKPIGLSALLLFAPAIIAGRAVATTPRVAEMLVPPGMFDRAEQGIERARTQKGYIEAPELLRPMLASRILTNNIQVAFLAFALGITGGILTAWVLLSNGVSIGAVFGLYHSMGIGGLLLAFVAPHGVLELSAISISGGAGFLLAAGVLLPGERTRRTALRENGQRAIRLVAGAALLLVFAGIIEGFISPIPDWPLRDKLMVSAVTAVALTAYLSTGIRFRRARSVL